MKRERFWLPACQPSPLRWPTCLIPFPGAYGYLDRTPGKLMPIASLLREHLPPGLPFADLTVNAMHAAELASATFGRRGEPLGLHEAFQQDCRSTKPGEWASREGNPWTPRIREM